MKKFLEIFDKSINTICAVALAATFLIVVLNVVLRYIFKSGLAWSEEGARYLFVFMVFLGIIPNTRDGSHFHITLVTGVLPKFPKKCVSIVKNILYIGLLSIIVRGAWVTSTHVVTKSAALKIPNTYVFRLLAFSGCVMILYVIRNMIAEFFSKNQETVSAGNIEKGVE